MQGKVTQQVVEFQPSRTGGQPRGFPRLRRDDTSLVGGQSFSLVYPF